MQCGKNTYNDSLYEKADADDAVAAYDLAERYAKAKVEARCRCVHMRIYSVAITSQTADLRHLGSAKSGILCGKKKMMPPFVCAQA